MSTFERPNYSQLSREELIERIRQVEVSAGTAFRAHPRYGLTEREEALLGILIACKDVCTRDHIFTLMYGMRLDPPEIKILDVYIAKLRPKLERAGIVLQTVWGRGWFMDRENRVKALAMRIDAAPPDEAADRLGAWLSAALDDPGVCAEMKADINAWFDAGQPSPAVAA